MTPNETTLTCKHCGRPLDLFCRFVDGICEDHDYWAHSDPEGFETYPADCDSPELADDEG